MVKIIEVNIPLFAMASIELPILGEEITETNILIEKGKELYIRLVSAAEIVEILRQNGWMIFGEVFNLCAFNDSIKTVKQAKYELQKLGVNLSDVYVREFNEIME